MTRTLRLVAGVCFVFVLHVNAAFADRIATVTATTNMGSAPPTSLMNTVNGNGLFVVTLTASHGGTTPLNSWVSSPGVLTGTVTFALGGSFLVDSFSFWNQNAGGPGPFGTTGIQRVEVLTSTDGVAFVLLAGGPSLFAQVTTISAGPQIFTFAPVLATHFRFNILSNYGDPMETGFAEVGFNSATVSVPEPSTLALLMIGLTAIARISKRM